MKMKWIFGRPFARSHLAPTVRLNVSQCLEHTRNLRQAIFKAKGLPKSVSFFDSPFARQKPILLIINFHDTLRLVRILSRTLR